MDNRIRKPILSRKRWQSTLASAFRIFSRRQVAHEQGAQEDCTVSEQKSAVAPSHSTRRSSHSLHLGVALPQRQCLLFGLPTEIRQLIYQNVFGPSIIHVESLGTLRNRLARVKCWKWQSSDGWNEHAHCEQGEEEEGIVKVDNSGDPNDQLLALCLTCRRT